MSGYTPNLNLFEYNPTTDGNQTFNIKNALNDNFNKIDTYCKGLSDDKADTDDVNTALALKADKTVLHALKGYSDNGELLTDAEGLANVIKYAHSTFDLSKFAVVGSPVITDDGIASGFSSSNYIGFTSGLNSLTKPFKVSCTFKTNFSSMSAPQPTWTIIDTSFASNSARLMISLDKKLVFQTYVSGTNQKTPDSSILLDNTWYKAICWQDNDGSMHLKYYPLGHEELAETKTLDTASLVNIQNVTTTVFGKSIHNHSEIYQGQTDLKQFSITVDGVPVFSGNKTGIDTIKPDNYTVVGTPTISADGIASGFSSSNYVSIQNLSFSQPFIFEFNEKVASNMAGCIGANAFNVQPKNTSGVYFIVGGSGNLYAVYNFAEENSVIYRISWDGLTYKLEIKGDTVKTEWRTIKTYESSSSLTGTSLRLGYNSNSVIASLGSYDLNKVKYYSNGNLVYQPCLKIPYTESKTGAKIVSSSYRDRVNDMAEQFGYANYYTLDEDNGNFTLPQVELYGYIEKRARDIAHPVAVPFFRLTDEINEDEVRLEGAEVDKGLYLAIEQKLAAYCSASEDTTKIILPNFTDRVPWGSNTQGYIEAGLPNITGSINRTRTYGDASGCFTNITGSGYNHLSETDSDGGVIGFDASRSSSIYGNSTTVQPPAFKVRWLARWR